MPAALVDARPGGRRARAAAAGRRVRPRPRRRRAVGPRRSARLGPQRRAGRARRSRRGRPASPPTTCTTPRPRAGRWPPRSPRCGPGGPSTSSTGGCPAAQVPTCARAPSRPAASPAIPAWSSAAAELGRACAFDLALVAPNLPPFPCPPGHDEMSWLRELTEARRRAALRAARHRARAPGPGRRSTTSSTSSSSSASPATSSSCGTSSSSAGGPTSSARGGARPPTRRSATRSASPRPTRCRSACCSSGSCRPSATARPTSTSTSRATAAKRSSSTSTSGTAATTRPRSPTSSPTGPSRRCATWPRRSATRPVSRTRGRSRSTRGGRLDSHHATHPSRTTSPPPVLELAAQVEHFPRHLGIHSGGMVLCDRPVIEVCPVEWGRMEGRTVLQWDKDDCAAVGLVKFDLLGLGHAHRRCTTRSTSSPSTAATRSTSRPSPRRTPSTTCCAGPTRSACSRSRAGPRWPPCPGSSRARSTTSWSRWRSSVPVRSRAGRCTPTSGGATARSRSPTCTRCSRTRWPRRSACRCSRSSSCRWRSTSPGSPRRRPISCARRWGRSAAVSAWSGCARGSTRAWPSGASPARSPTAIFDKLGRVRQLRLPREPLGVVRLPRLRDRRGSSCTTRRRSARRCSTPSRWASTRRTRWCRTPAATASRCAPPTSTPRRDARRRRLGAVRGVAQRRGRAARAVGRCVTSGDDLAERIEAEHGHGPYCEHGGPQAPGAGASRSPVLEALATAGAFGCFADATAAARPRRALWAAGAVAQSRPRPAGGRGHRRRRAALCRA